MNRSLVYNPTQFQQHLWNYHKLTDKSAQVAEQEGNRRYEAFSDFSSEIYHRLYAEIPEKLETPAPGAEPFIELHNRIDEIPEMKDLRQRCMGNEQWSGMSTAAIIDTLMHTLEKPSEIVEDLRKDEEVKKFLERLIAAEKNKEKNEALQETLDEHMQSYSDKQQANQNATNLMDATDIRTVVRNAAKKANQKIDKEENMMDGLSFGTEEHSGKRARSTMHKKLSKIVQDNERLKRIAELAGRMRRIALNQQKQKPTKGTNEVTGIEMGADLARLVPSEALYMDDAVEAVFFKKMHEQALLQFELSKTPKKEQGPIIMLTDSSGSMKTGDADIWAAAVNLAFLEIAYKQKRPFAIIHFGSNVLREDTIKDWSQVDHAKVLESINFFAADGGTNFQKPLSKAIEIIEDTGSFSEADIVMVTDGHAKISSGFLEEVWKKDKKGLGFKCYSILVGQSTNAKINEQFSDEVIKLSDAIKNDSAMHKLFQEV